MSTQTPARHVIPARRSPSVGLRAVLVGFLRTASLLMSLASVAVVTLGLVLIVDDRRDRTEMFDGLGMVAGACLMVGGLVLVAVGLVTSFLLKSIPTLGACIACVLGGVVLAAGDLALGLGLDLGPYVMVGALAVSVAGIVVGLGTESNHVAPPTLAR